MQPFLRTVRAAAWAALWLLFPGLLWAQGTSPWVEAVNELQAQFTGPIARGLSLIAIVVEIDRREGVWTIPATRMKAQREHRVPLCRRATEILSAARKLGDGSSLVFTRGGGKPLYEKRLRRLLRNCRIAAVPHGFRSSFRDWAAEETDHPREVIEAALAHVVQNKVEAAYMRTDLFERRRRLMDDWAAYLADKSRDPEAGPVR